MQILRYAQDDKKVENVPLHTARCPRVNFE